jgi:hypothetical protein
MDDRPHSLRGVAVLPNYQSTNHKHQARDEPSDHIVTGAWEWLAGQFPDWTPVTWIGSLKPQPTVAAVL